LAVLEMSCRLCYNRKAPEHQKGRKTSYETRIMTEDANKLWPMHTLNRCLCSLPTLAYQHNGPPFRFYAAPVFFLLNALWSLSHCR
jgi:hypothetical protein